jgi:glycosyltransferase involved in cell wall biosynthesis
MLSDITPVLLTYNEAPNIERSLRKLAWAKDIVIVDSGSTDGTASLAKKDPRVRWYTRPFDSHVDQWNFAIRETAIRTPWALCLDADYVLSDELVGELERLSPGDASGYRARFIYCLGGRSLRASIYPPVTVLFRLSDAAFRQDGHTQRVVVRGKVDTLVSPILHDDRKPFRRWFASQKRYMTLEARKIASSPFSSLDAPDKVRRLVVIAPPAVFLYCYLGRLAILDGVPGFIYSCQRMLAETLLSFYLAKALFIGERGPA